MENNEQPKKKKKIIIVKKKIVKKKTSNEISIREEGDTSTIKSENTGNNTIGGYEDDATGKYY